MFSLIDNLDNITYNFSGSSYYVSRSNIVENYPKYSKIVYNSEINKNSFNEYVEKVLNDSNFVKEYFDKIIKKN